MKQTVRVLMDLIRAEVTGAAADSAAFLALTEEEQNETAALAKDHSLAQLLGDGLGRDPEAAALPVVKSLVRESMLALSHTAKLDKERNKICALLDRAEIPYVCLKGARIRPYYPEPWMRTSCDNDILVPEKDVDRAAALLSGELGYTCGERDYHDISLFSKTGVHLELHFSIREDTEQMDRVLSRVWDHCNPVPGSFERVQSPEFFLFHLIAHMAYHFVHGGCGVRPFVDLFLLETKLPRREEEVAALCREAGIHRFYENVQALTAVWFKGAAHTAATCRMEEYILSGGVFGTHENSVAVDRQRQGGKAGYLLHRIFMPADGLCRKYPSLEKHRWLAPAYQLRRWAEGLTPEKLGNARQDLDLVRSTEDSAAARMERMLEENGLG